MTHTIKPSTWRERIWHARQAWEQAVFYARRGQYRLEVSIRKNGDVFAKLEQCLPPIHAVERVAHEEWKSGSVSAEDAMRWCERTADERRT